MSRLVALHARYLLAVGLAVVLGLSAAVPVFAAGEGTQPQVVGGTPVPNRRLSFCGIAWRREGRSYGVQAAFLWRFPDRPQQRAHGRALREGYSGSSPCASSWEERC